MSASNLLGLRRRVLALALVIGTAAGSSQLGNAATIFVDTSIGGGQVGAFYGPYTLADDPPVGYPAVPAPDNDPIFQNYFMGRSTIGGFTTSERRPFFFFDMASVSIPAGEVITSVSIDLELLPGGTSALANFATGDIEMVDFTSTPYGPPEILDPVGSAIPYEDIWSTFGSSIPYGGFEIIGPDHPSLLPTAPDTYTIPLDGAIPDLTATILAGDIFTVTAKLATFDPGPIGSTAPPAVDLYEYVFGLTDVVSGGGSLTAAPELVITTALELDSSVPEPSTLTLAALGFLVLLRRRRQM